MTQWTKDKEIVEELPEGCIGFVYLITNIITGRKYIGKKSGISRRTKTKTVTLKTTGEKKKKKVRTTAESNWRDYYGSSEDLCADVEFFGVEAFDREILRYCFAPGELSYYEARYQMLYDVLLSPEEWYNAWISVKVHRTHLKHLHLDKQD